MASWKVGGENKRARGSAESLAKEIPANPQDLKITRNQSRMEVFVTSGKPSDSVLAPTNQGLELVPITHPNDLFAGGQASFRFLIDGKPAAGVEVTVIPGGVRYRDQLGEIKASTDADGKFNVQWPAAGMYWLTASHGAAPGAAGPSGTLGEPVRRASYSATLEVLPQ